MIYGKTGGGGGWNYMAKYLCTIELFFPLIIPIAVPILLYSGAGMYLHVHTCTLCTLGNAEPGRLGSRIGCLPLVSEEYLAGMYVVGLGCKVE